VARSVVTIGDQEYFTNSAFLAVFAHPVNSQYRIVTIGSYDIKNMRLIQKTNPCKAWFDCRVIEPVGDYQDTHTISKLNTGVK